VSPNPVPETIAMLWLRNLYHTATVVNREGLELRYLSCEAEDAAVASILQLSNSIFNPEPESHYASLEVWTERLSDPPSTIVYLVPTPGRSADSSGDHQPDGIPPPVAFLFAYPRSHPEPLKNGSQQSLHIWLAGVLEEYRGRGCLDTMVNALLDHVKSELGEPESLMMLTLTICTTPSRFPSMWAWLRARTGWVPEKEFEGGKVMLSFTVWCNFD
jgi:ribosomal protein S18 acetylase RimI-like enzyme